MNNIFSKPISILAIVVSISACTQQKTTETTTKDTTRAAIAATADSIALQNPGQDKVFKQYLQLKDALVASDAAKTQKAAGELSLALQADPSYAKAAQMTDSIANNSDLAKQRSTFTNLSNQLISQFKKAKLSKGSFYVQFCPMANEGNGGYWLAAEQEVRNPYYGNDMLNCGEVKETIK